MSNNVLKFSQGQTLIREGEASKCMYLIQKGILEVYKEKHGGGGEKVKLGQVIQGELVGEMSFVDQQRRCATVVCLTDCEVIEIAEDKFSKYLSEQPLWWQALIKTLVARLRSANKYIKV